MMICNAHCHIVNSCSKAFKGFRLLALLASAYATHAFGSPWKQCSSTSADEKSPEIENSKDHFKQQNKTRRAMEVVQKNMLETSTIPQIRDNTNAFHKS